MDSTEGLFESPIVTDSLRSAMTPGTLSVVARDGIEPPTPAFSGLDSPEANTLILSARRLLRSPITPRFLGQ